MNCRKTRKMLEDYVNEFLAAEDSRSIQKHVVECDSCRRELDMLRKVLGLIDEVKVEYPEESVWRNFLPDLHKRIETEALIAFRGQQRQRLYLLPGWIASAAAIVMLFSSLVMLRSYPPTSPIQLQRTENIGMAKAGLPPAENSSEPVLVAGVISNVLITEAEAAELEKLRSFIQSETSTLPDYYYYEGDDILADMSAEASDTEDDEGIIQFLLENQFAEFDDSSMVESDDTGSGKM